MLPTGPRIGALIRLLASDKDGEVVAAARAIGRTLKNAGTDFHELAASVEHGNDWRAMTDWLLLHGERLSTKEQAFVRDMMNWRGKPTERQATWLLALFEREHGRGR